MTGNQPIQSSFGAGIWRSWLQGIREWRWQIGIVLVLWLWLFGSMLAGSETPGYRDSAYLYFPLFEWITAQLQQGQSPLWSPMERAGVSVSGETVSGLFYPGKAILLLPFGTFVFRYNLFIALHVLLASLTATGCARRLGLARNSSALAGVSFAFSGPVLFQCTNLIYLISAAWLPVAVGELWSLRIRLSGTGPPPGNDRLRSRALLRHGLIFAAALAMMILGGEPELACVTMLLAAFTLGRSWRGVATWLGLGCGVAVLAAVQILPGMNWAQWSQRLDNRSACLWLDASQQFALNGWQGLASAFRHSLSEPQAGTHHAHVYQFSQPPWTIVETIWPGVSGTPWPLNSRWLDELPGADRMWQPSLFQGLCIVVLGCSAAVGLRKEPLARWLTAWTIFFGMAAWGWFGLGWLTNELGRSCGWRGFGEQLGGPFLGAYWWLVTWIPGFSTFRYPAKLWILVSLGLALLAGLALDRLAIHRLVRNTGSWLALAIALISAMGLLTGIEQTWPTRIAELSGADGLSDQLFGPLDLSRSAAVIRGSLLSGILAAMAVFILTKMPTRLETGSVWLVLLGIELLAAQRAILPLVPAGLIQKPAYDTSVQEDFHRIESLGYRVFVVRPSGNLPRRFFETRSPDRLGEIADWQRSGLYPRWNWRVGPLVENSFSPIQPAPRFLPSSEFWQYLMQWSAAMTPAVLQESLKRIRDSQGDEDLILAPRVFRMEGPMAIGESSDDESAQAAFQTSKGPSPVNQRYAQYSMVGMTIVKANSGRIHVQLDPVRGESLLLFPEAWSGEWVVEYQTVANRQDWRRGAWQSHSGVQGVRIPPFCSQVRLVHITTGFWNGFLISMSAWLFWSGLWYGPPWLLGRTGRLKQPCLSNPAA